MLSETNIAQILEEHQVLEQEPEAAEQHLDVVLLAIGERRADLRKRDSRLEDGVFAAWAICLPGWPQDARYHSLMRARRAQWFTNISIRTASRRAAGYFTTELLGLE